MASSSIGTLACHKSNEISGAVNFLAELLDELAGSAFKGPFLFNGWWHAIGQRNFKKRALIAL
jgi:hypothetical protein